MPKPKPEALKQTEVKTKDAAKREPKSLNTMFGIGLPVMIGGQEYELAPISIKKLHAVGELIARCPNLLITHALAAAANGGDFDDGKTIELIHSLNVGSEAELPPDSAIRMAITTGSFMISEEEIGAMAELTALLLSRRHEVTAEEIADELDIPTFLNIVCTMYQVNPSQKQRFSTPPAPIGE